MKLTKEQRFKKIEEFVQQKNKVTVNELATALDTTPETIRSDLRQLEVMQKLIRYHGGAVSVNNAQKELQFSVKLNMNKKAKRAIAKAAASYIESNDVIYVDVGTTTVHLAPFLRGENIKIITNSLAAATAFGSALEKKQFTGEIICLGGIVNNEQQSLSGAITLLLLETFQIQKAFISCGSITENEVFDYDLNEALISRQVVSRCQQTYLLADKSKLNGQSFAKICNSTEFSQILSDGDCPFEKLHSIWQKVEN